MPRSMKKRVECALKEHSPNHVLAVKMGVGVTTIHRILHGDEPVQSRVRTSVLTFLDENGF